ncbi:hypothetical protein V3F56_14305 [Moorellaceae bacterium AZ2]
MRHRADAEGILQACTDAHRVVVVGGSFVGLEAGRRGRNQRCGPGQMGLTPIWPNACAQGRIAAYNMAGLKGLWGPGAVQLEL